MHINNGESAVSVLFECSYCIQTDFADLCGCRLEGAPCVETAGETVRLVALAHQAQFSGVLRILRPHVLNIDLRGTQMLSRHRGVHKFVFVPKNGNLKCRGLLHKARMGFYTVKDHI